MEADTYWCLTKLLDGIQDHYTFAQPGIQRMVYELKNLIRRINQPLHDHLEEQGVGRRGGAGMVKGWDSAL